MCIAQPYQCTNADPNSWNKLLPKKDETFDLVMTHLRSTNVPEVCARYAGLYERIVQCKVAALKNTIYALHTTPPWQRMDALMSPGRSYDEAYAEMHGLQICDRGGHRVTVSTSI